MEYSQEKLHGMNLDQLLKLAKKKHKEGFALESRQIYSYILFKFPKNKKAKNGIKLLDSNRRSQSVVQDPPRANLSELLTLFNKAEFLQVLEKANPLLVKFPNSTFLNNICGASNTNLKKYASAIKNYKAAISITPSDPDVLYNLGVALRASGEPNDAAIYFKKAIKIKPDHLEAFASIAGVMTDQGNLDMALQYYQRALEIDPNNHKILFNMGNSLRDSGRLDAAREYYVNAISIRPRFFEAHINLASIFSLQDDLSSAAASYELAIKINPQSTETYLSLGGVLATQGANDRALGILNQALSLDPLCAKAYFLKALILQKQGHLLNAISAIEKAIEIRPTDAEFKYSMAVIQQEMGNLDPAIASYNKALELEPGNADALFNQTLAYLSQRNFTKGWPLYERRWTSTSCTSLRLITDKPKWEPHGRGRVLLWTEQGVGDLIMFASIFSELYAKSEKLIMQIDDRLIPLFKRSFPKDIIYYSLKETVPEAAYDSHIPFGDLPLYFRDNLDSFKQTSTGYLRSEQALSAKLRKKLKVNNSDYLVGICWRGGSGINGVNKSMDLSQLAHALPNKKVKIINLQYGDTDHECQELEAINGITIHNVSEVDNFHDIDGLTSLIDACDHVVSVSTLAVHLAGALGKRATVILPLSPDWRWGPTHQDSYWYDSLKLFRQERILDWSAPLKKLKSEFDHI